METAIEMKNPMASAAGSGAAKTGAGMAAKGAASATTAGAVAATSGGIAGLSVAAKLGIVVGVVVLLGVGVGVGVGVGAKKSSSSSSSSSNPTGLGDDDFPSGGGGGGGFFDDDDFASGSGGGGGSLSDDGGGVVAPSSSPAPTPGPLQNLGAWEAIPGMLCAQSGACPTVYSVAVVGAHTFAAGNIYRVQSPGEAPFTVQYIADWFNDRWWSLGGGPQATVFALASLGSKLVVGGSFTSATQSWGAEVQLGGIAFWDVVQSQWSAVGTIQSGSVNGLFTAPSGTFVYVTGNFRSILHAGSAVLNSSSIATLSGGGVWGALGRGLYGPTVNELYPPGVSTMTTAPDGATVYAYGEGLDTAVQGNGSPMAFQGIAVWSTATQTWSRMPWQLSSGISAMVVFQGDLHVGGYFTALTSPTAGTLLRWNGDEWVAPATVSSPFTPGEGRLAYITTLLPLDEDNLFVGGYFREASAPGRTLITCRNVAQWNGYSWAPVAGGIAGPFMNTRDEVRDVAKTSEGDVVITADFGSVVQPDGSLVQSFFLARWDASNTTYGPAPRT